MTAISKDGTKIMIERSGKAFPLSVSTLSQEDQDFVTAKSTLDNSPEPESFTLDLKKGRTVTVSVLDTNAKVVMVLCPGGDQSKLTAGQLIEAGKNVTQLGFASATFYTNFGPLIDHTERNNRYFHDVLSGIKKRYGNRDFVFLGMSNGGLTIMQAIEDNRSASRILALIPTPTSYVARKNLKGLPVMFRMGANDELGWADMFDDLKKQLERGGAKLDAKLLPNEGHIPPVDFQEISTWLRGHKIVPGNAYVR